jgi:hypothetical protein
VFFASILLSYALISAADEVDKIKQDEKINREEAFEDNFIVWRNFPIKVGLAFPDFINYMKDIFVKKDLSSISA